MKFLAELNVVFPLLLSQHPHRAEALEWFNTVAPGELVLAGWLGSAFSAFDQLRR